MIIENIILKFVRKEEKILVLMNYQMVIHYFNQYMGNNYYVCFFREADTRRYRHDINNHLMCLRALVDGNIEAQNYIDNLQEKLYVIKNKSYETGFQLMNILLGNYLSEIEKMFPFH